MSILDIFDIRDFMLLKTTATNLIHSLVYIINNGKKNEYYFLFLN